MKAKEQGVLYNLSAERRVNNPRLWDDDECVKSVFDKLEDFG